MQLYFPSMVDVQLGNQVEWVSPMTIVARKFRLGSRANELSSADNLELVERAVDAPRTRQLLVRHKWISIDTYTPARLWALWRST